MADEKKPGETVLDEIEAEAIALTAAPSQAGQGTTFDNATGQPEPEPAPPSPAMFAATHEMIVGTIKMGLKKYPGGDQAGKVWEGEFFKNAVMPVLVKYNITLENLPCELVLFGAILMAAKETSKIIKAAQTKADDKQTDGTKG